MYKHNALEIFSFFCLTIYIYEGLMKGVVRQEGKDSKSGSEMSYMKSYFSMPFFIRKRDSKIE